MKNYILGLMMLTLGFSAAACQSGLNEQDVFNDVPQLTDQDQEQTDDKKDAADEENLADEDEDTDEETAAVAEGMPPQAEPANQEMLRHKVEPMTEKERQMMPCDPQPIIKKKKEPVSS